MTPDSARANSSSSSCKPDQPRIARVLRDARRGGRRKALHPTLVLQHLQLPRLAVRCDETYKTDLLTTYANEMAEHGVLPSIDDQFCVVAPGRKAKRTARDGALEIYEKLEARTIDRTTVTIIRRSPNGTRSSSRSSCVAVT